MLIKIINFNNNLNKFFNQIIFYKMVFQLLYMSKLILKILIFLCNLMLFRDKNKPMKYNL